MYKIKIKEFEGPLDLLLFFIKRDELNIYDIPISYITNEFLEYMKYIQLIDLEVAGDFIFMASTLMQIKVRMLLPREVDEKGVEIDPRNELVQRLLEYKRYKEMSEDFGILEAQRRKVQLRGNFDYDSSEAPPEFELLLKNISVFDLAKAFARAIKNIKKEVTHDIKKPAVSIEEQIDFIKEMIDKDGEVHFYRLIYGMTEKFRLVVTFIALLEMTKMGLIGIKESGTHNDFIIYALDNG